MAITAKNESEPQPQIPDGSNNDPSKNVLDLTRAEGRRQDDLRDTGTLRQDDLRVLDNRRQDELREALDLRHTALNAQRDKFDERFTAQRDNFDQRLAGQRDMFETRLENTRADAAKRIADILERQQDKSALLLSGTVDKLGATTNERISAVEKNQYVRGGESSVADPALAIRLNEMSALLRAGQTTDDKAAGGGIKQTTLVGYLFAAVTAAGVIFAIIMALSNKEPVRHQQETAKPVFQHLILKY